ncbi:MAG: hypothetical protein Q4G64_05815 [bacterium]|nr:hypothetical protein [bacterium]
MTLTRTAAVALALALPLLAGCGLRIDAPDPSPPPPSPAEALRQREALRSAAFADGAATWGVAGSPSAERLAVNASLHLDALGGVWEPWPDGDGPAEPDGLPLYPAPAPEFGPFETSDDLVDALAQSTPEVCEAALDATEPEAVSLYSAICFSRTLDWDGVSRDFGIIPPEVPAVPETVGSQDPGLILTLDAAAWATDFQAAAARAAEDEGWQGLEATARGYRDLALAITSANGWTGTEQDPRLPSYDPNALPDQTAIAAAIAEAAVLALPNSTNRESVLDLALHYGLTASRQGVQFDALTGLEESGPTDESSPTG